MLSRAKRKSTRKREHKDETGKIVKLSPIPYRYQFDLDSVTLIN